MTDYEGKMVPCNITADYENLQPAVSAKAEDVAEVSPPQSGGHLSKLTNVLESSVSATLFAS